MLVEPNGVLYGWGDRERESELVYEQVGPEARDLKSLKNFVPKLLPMGTKVLDEKTFKLGAFTGLEWNGITDNGLPYTCRLISMREHSFVYSSQSLDANHNREFVRSFGLVSSARKEETPPRRRRRR